jgi:hypothetical protein
MLKVTPGHYRTRDGGVVEIARQHPRYPDLWLGSNYDADENPGAYWWDTGVHPHNGENDLIERIEDGQPVGAEAGG